MVIGRHRQNTGKLLEFVTSLNSTTRRFLRYALQWYELRRMQFNFDDCVKKH